MNRRSFLQVSSLVAAESMLPRAPWLLHAAEAAPAVTSFEVPADGKRIAISDSFMGLGYEISSVTQPGLLSAGNQVYVQLVRTLGANGVIRIGGNTADYARYVGDGAPVSSPKGTVVNDASLKDLGAFLEKTGWQLIWALNLGNGSVENAVAEAKRVREAAGRKMLAFEIGNEPDLFSHEKHRPSGYDYQQWLADYRRVKTALRAELPDVAFAGPDVAVATDWVTQFAADEGKDAAVLTHHYYREGQNPTSSIPKLLGPDPKLAGQLAKLQEASEKSGVPYRICEVNSFSGGGRPGVSDSFAAALWVLDYMFTLASYGCSGVNMETGVNQLGFVSSYSPVGDDQHGNYSAPPEYYGMLAFSLAGKGQLLPLGNMMGPASAKAYATRGKDGSLALTLINKGESDCTFDVSLDRQLLPGKHHARHASVMQLLAPAIDAKSGVTLGGSAVAPTGEWSPTGQTQVALKDGRLRWKVAAGSASLVSIAG